VWVQLVRGLLVGLLYQTWMIGEYRGDGGMRIGKGNWSTWRGIAPVPPRTPQIPYDLMWYWKSLLCYGTTMRRMIGLLLKSELESLCQDTAVTQLDVLSLFVWKTPEKPLISSARIAGLKADIWVWHVKSTTNFVKNYIGRESAIGRPPLLLSRIF
jgi:hypothetical protein